MQQVIEVEDESVNRIARQFVFLIQIYALARESGLPQEKIAMLKHGCVRQGTLLRRALKRHLSEFGLSPPGDEIIVWCEGLEIALQANDRGSLSVTRMSLPSAPLLEDFWREN